MKYHKLRIVWSVVLGIAALMLICLWVRSYWWTDTSWGGVTSNYAAAFWSSHGHVLGVVSKVSLGAWQEYSAPLRTRLTAQEVFGSNRAWLFEFDVPHYLFVFICAAIAPL